MLTKILKNKLKDTFTISITYIFVKILSGYNQVKFH